ncbi:MAG: hypothetical protein GF313_10830 [Caldithrix sp.]|nr:hypothetical protein [Caldithrix sp.]
MAIHNQTIILIFPWQTLAREMIAYYKALSVNLFIFVDQNADMQYLLRTFRDFPSNTSIHHIEKPITSFWQSLPDEKIQKLSEPDIVFNFIGNEFLQIDIRGEGEEWQIDANDKPQIHFAFVEELIERLSLTKKITWLNVVYGRTKLSDGKQVFCQSRYGIMGFNNLIRLNPDLQKINIYDVCLTYLRHKQHKDKVEHCQYCSKETFGDHAFDLREPGTIRDFLVNTANEKLNSNG